MHLQCRRPLVQFLGQEDPLEKEMETHSSIQSFISVSPVSNQSCNLPRSLRLGNDAALLASDEDGELRS